ncbi:hypothetical protein Leryth_026933 [Lithospermum erythrorhizon]|nr:hypothetical protein Leryth_026933 [Lithospermum erythrorhizon]
MPDKNVVTWATMVWGYARNGFIDKARMIFEEMPERNVVAWTVMIRAYAEDRQVDEALKLFREMPERNEYSWNAIIQGCLLDKRVDEAIELFWSRPSRNTISWTILITGLAENGLLGLAREYFDQMPKKDIAAWNAMITAYAEEGLMVEADELFNLMPMKNSVTYYAMINGFSKNRSEAEAFWYLILMLRNQIRPTEATITSILISCESISKLLQSHGIVVRLGFMRQTSITNLLVTMYSKIGDVSSARVAFDDIPTKDVVSWTAMILAYSNHGYANRALETFARMFRSGIRTRPKLILGTLVVAVT